MVHVNCSLINNTWDLVYSKAVSELNIFVQKLNLKKIMVNYKTVFNAFFIGVLKLCTIPISGYKSL